MSTGDLKNNLRILQRELKKIGYPHKLQVDGFANGSCADYLPIYHYVFLEYSRPLGKLLLDLKYDLFGKSDLKFIETVYKVLREVFTYKPPITKEQFFSGSYAELKLIMCTQVINLVHEKHRSLATFSSLANSGVKKQAVATNSYSAVSASKPVSVVQESSLPKQQFPDDIIPNKTAIKCSSFKSYHSGDKSNWKLNPNLNTQRDSSSGKDSMRDSGYSGSSSLPRHPGSSWLAIETVNKQVGKSASINLAGAYVINAKSSQPGVVLNEKRYQESNRQVLPTHDVITDSEEELDEDGMPRPSIGNGRLTTTANGRPRRDFDSDNLADSLAVGDKLSKSRNCDDYTLNILSSISQTMLQLVSRIDEMGNRISHLESSMSNSHFASEEQSRKDSEELPTRNHISDFAAKACDDSLTKNVNNMLARLTLLENSVLWLTRQQSMQTDVSVNNRHLSEDVPHTTSQYEGYNYSSSKSNNATELTPPLYSYSPAKQLRGNYAANAYLPDRDERANGSPLLTPSTSISSHGSKQQTSPGLLQTVLDKETSPQGSAYISHSVKDPYSDNHRLTSSDFLPSSGSHGSSVDGNVRHSSSDVNSRYYSEHSNNAAASVSFPFQNTFPSSSASTLQAYSNVLDDKPSYSQSGVNGYSARPASYSRQPRSDTGGRSESTGVVTSSSHATNETLTQADRIKAILLSTEQLLKSKNSAST